MVPVQILLIQFRARQITAELEYQSIGRELGGLVQLVPLSALNDLIQWNQPAQLLGGYSGVIFGGSGDLDFDGGRSSDDLVVQTSHALLEKLRPLLNHLFSKDMPTLGICYGHQLIGAYAGATVIHDPVQKKSRSHTVAVVARAEADRLCAAIPGTFTAHYGHKDSLDRVPEGAVLLCSGGEACKVSALRYQNNIYSTQFHPELTLDDMRLRVAAIPGYLPDGVCIEEVFSDKSESGQMLRNFSQLVLENDVRR